jgi:hypothetical protein
MAFVHLGQMLTNMAAQQKVHGAVHAIQLRLTLAGCDAA